MTQQDLSREELELLAAARRDLTPSAERVARMLHDTRLAIGSGAEVPGELAEPSALTTALSGSVVRNVAAWTAIAVVSAVLGYKAGFAVGEERARQQSVSAPRALDVPAPRSTTPPAPVIAPQVEAQPTVAGPALEPPVARKPRAKEVGSVLAAPQAPAPPAPEPAVASSSLDAEVKALRSVERALRNREPRRALELLAQLDGVAANGQLMEERAAARAMAQCEERAASGKADQADAMQRVLEFSQRYPASVYFARVRRTCLATMADADPIDSGNR